MYDTTDHNVNGYVTHVEYATHAKKDRKIAGIDKIPNSDTGLTHFYDSNLNKNAEKNGIRINSKEIWGGDSYKFFNKNRCITRNGYVYT